MIAILFIPVLYLKGLWFLFSRPFEFFAFIKEWERYKAHIEENDEIARSGYYHLPRRLRRSKKLKNIARKQK